MIGEEGEQLGVVPFKEALEKAQDLGLDLVEVAGNATPVVCRIMDYGKYKYQMRKKANESKKKQSIIHVKEIKIGVKTDKHDLNFKVKNAGKFLSGGDKVKVSIRFKGREITHPELARDILKRVAEDLKEFGQVETPPKFEGRSMMMIIGPLTAKK